DRYPSVPAFANYRDVLRDKASGLEHFRMPNQLAADILHFSEVVSSLGSPEAVLNSLDGLTYPQACAHVLGAALLPLNFGRTDSLVIGKTVFLHASVPKGWWEERMHHSSISPAPADIAARLALAPFTFADIMKSLEPIGVDRWAYELNLK